MNPTHPAMLLILLVGCGSTNGAGNSWDESQSITQSQVCRVERIALADAPSGRMRTTLFYGPWQCRQQFMDQCQSQCAREGYLLKGCMWLADLKFDWEGSLIALPVPVKAGSRYGIYHCCCNYPTLTKVQTKASRDQWKGVMKSFRKNWSERFGEWPSQEGVSWPGHHIQDLWHGGDPTDPNNVIPAEPGRHGIFNEQYPLCYGGQAPWDAVGPDLPYTDN